MVLFMRKSICLRLLVIVDRRRPWCIDFTSLYITSNKPCNWFQRFSSAIQEISFQQSRADYSLLTQVCAKSITVVLLYIDEMIIIRNDEDAISNLKKFLNGWLLDRRSWTIKILSWCKSCRLRGWDFKLSTNVHTGYI